MFSGSQIATAKLVHRNQHKELIDNQTEDLVNISVSIPRPKPDIFVENSSEKLQRKVLVDERKHERIIEQQKVVEYMNNLMEKVLHEKSLSKKDEDTLRNKVQTIMNKVTKESDKIDEPSLQSSPSRVKSQSNQGSFLLWHDKNFHRN